MYNAHFSLTSNEIIYLLFNALKVVYIESIYNLELCNSSQMLFKKCNIK